MTRTKVLVVSSHPVQYLAPLYVRYAQDPRIDLTVAYCSLHGAEQARDAGFRTEFAWDVPLLNGYRWVHLRNYSPRPRVDRALGLLNPGLWKLVRRGRFDVVVSNGYRGLSFWIAIAAGRLSGASLALVLDTHTLVPRDEATWKAPVKRFVLPGLYRIFNGFLAPSTRTAGFLRGLGVQDSRIFLVPHTVDVPFFIQAASRTHRKEIRKKWRLPPESRVALYSGKLVSWKRPQDLLAAAAEVNGLYLLFAGDGALRSRLEAMSKHLGIEHRVRFLGFLNQTQLPAAYVASDFLVLPSIYEPFGLVVNEAFSCGIPAIVTESCGATPDLVQDGVTGFVVPATDTAALRGRLKQLVEDPQLLRDMSERARKRISAWGPSQNVEGFVTACRRLAETSRSVA